MALDLTTGLSTSLLTTTRFGVSIQGASQTQGLFAECSGLGAELTTEELRGGGMGQIPYLRIKGVKFTPLRLKRGLITADMLTWVLDWADPNSSARPTTVVVSMFSNVSEARMDFTLWRAIPTKWAGPSLSASQGQFAMEELEFTYEWLEAGT